ncbi:S1C family serine protease [Luteirhabdus pelagi]|uniref:S1C family serine protease n=1 Tax=Luteirhabdus pelagi TaxID=2792783 RepID=UPI00193ADE3C|nr:serine protease [Luteirhabdus pelagi]
MKKLTLVFSIFVLVISSCGEAGLDTKLIASQYYQGVVKILLIDPELEKEGEGKGLVERGSGFIVTEDGYLFTNKHVVEKCVKGYLNYSFKHTDGKAYTAIETYSEELTKDKSLVSVRRTGYTEPYIQVFHGRGENDYKLYKAEVIALGDGGYDGAMLKIVSDDKGNPIRTRFKPVPLDNADKIRQGEQLCVYGFPMNYDGAADWMMRDLSTLSIGIMSGYDYVMNPDYGYIKTDAEIHPGNSGGPVFNENNKVVGIATAKGNKTGIGLIGGINGMYFISALDNKAHKQLVDAGLTFPERASSINTIPGTKQKIKSAFAINLDIALRKPKKPKETYRPTTSYSFASMYFAVFSTADNGGKFPSAEERKHTRFRINPAVGANKIWIYVSNGLKRLGTKRFKVNVHRKTKSGQYSYYTSFYVNDVPENSYITHFPYKFPVIGDYKISVYSEEGKYITSKAITLIQK